MFLLNLGTSAPRTVRFRNRGKTEAISWTAIRNCRVVQCLPGDELWPFIANYQTRQWSLNRDDGILGTLGGLFLGTNAVEKDKAFRSWNTKCSEESFFFHLRLDWRNPWTQELLTIRCKCDKISACLPPPPREKNEPCQMSQSNHSNVVIKTYVIVINLMKKIDGYFGSRSCVCISPKGGSSH